MERGRTEKNIALQVVFLVPLINMMNILGDTKNKMKNRITVYTRV